MLRGPGPQLRLGPGIPEESGETEGFQILRRGPLMRPRGQASSYFLTTRPVLGSIASPSFSSAMT